MENKQLIAIDARINYIARVFDLEPFVAQKSKRPKKRKIMTRFLQGIGATLLVIVMGYAVIIEVKFNKIHFKAYTSCANCNDRGRHSFKNGIVLFGHKFNCTNCGVMGKMNSTNTLIPIEPKDE